jgi:hypothetical protein
MVTTGSNGMKTSLYQRTRAKHQQPTTNDPCFVCGNRIAENAHLRSFLDLRRGGFPPEVINEPWNLIPLCRKCHWLFDDREDIWVGYHMKMLTIPRFDTAMEDFINFLMKSGVKAELLKGLKFSHVPPTVWEVDRALSDDLIIITRAGNILIKSCPCEWNDDHDFNKQCADPPKRISELWFKFLEQRNTQRYTKKEWSENRKTLKKKFADDREALLEKLKEKMALAEKKVLGLLREKLLYRVLNIGDILGSDVRMRPEIKDDLRITGRISGFDVRSVSDGRILVYLWRND